MENKILMVSNAEHEQARIDYISSDLLQHAYLCTDPNEIAALKSQAIKCGLFEVSNQIEEVWSRYQKEAIKEFQVEWYQRFWNFNF